jgi:perosamine synthetase
MVSPTCKSRPLQTRHLQPLKSERVIPLCEPCLSGREVRYVVEALETNWVSYVGPHVQKFEQLLVEASGAPHAVAMNSGTSALHIALILSGVGMGHEVVMPAVSFVAPANAIRYCGAWPAFVDIRKEDWQMCADQTREFLHKGCKSTPEGLVNKKTGRIVKAIMLVHLLGGMGDVDDFAKIAEEFGLFLIEDAAECLGATYKNRRMAASNEHIDSSRRLIATSFNGNKIVTTGGGGTLFSHDEEVAKNAKHLSTTAKADPVEFFHDALGYNYRLTNLSAALGVGQLEVLNDHVARKREIAVRYQQAFDGMPQILQIHPEPENCRSAFWMFTIRLDRLARPVVDALGKLGIVSRPLWRPMFELPAMKGSSQWGSLEESVALCRAAISLPCSANLKISDQSFVVENFKSLLFENNV